MEKINKVAEIASGGWVIVKFLYPKLLDGQLKGTDWFECADKEYNLLKVNCMVLGTLMSLANKNTKAIKELNYHRSYNLLIPVIHKFRDLNLQDPVHVNLVQKVFHKLSYEAHTVLELFFEVVSCIEWYNENYGDEAKG